MKMFMSILFCASLFVALWFSIVILARLISKQDLGFQFAVWGFCWMAVITYLMGIWG